MASTEAVLKPAAHQRVFRSAVDSFWAGSRFLRNKPLGAFGVIVLLITVVFAIFAGPISRFGPEQLNSFVVDEELEPGATRFDGLPLQSIRTVEFVEPIAVEDLRVGLVELGQVDATVEALSESKFRIGFSFVDELLLLGIEEEFGPIAVLGLQRNAKFTSPNGTYWLGTDEFGRDVFSRIVHGARISLRVGFVSVILGTAVGAVLGMVSGYIGGRFDMIVQRIMDALMALPGLILALMVVAALGVGEIPVIIAIALSLGPNANRLLRAQCLSIKERPYVEAARAVGASDTRIIAGHILPNSLAPFLIIATAGLGAAILVEASLSFLGFGVPPPAPSWGGMLTGNAQQFALSAPWLAIVPGVAISLAVFAFNVLGDALRDVWDPRLRGR